MTADALAEFFRKKGIDPAKLTTIERTWEEAVRKQYQAMGIVEPPPETIEANVSLLRDRLVAGVK
jgi:hypothetical protein